MNMKVPLDLSIQLSGMCYRNFGQGRTHSFPVLWTWRAACCFC